VKALIVDDERLARVRLRKLLEAHPDVHVVAEADSVSAARTAIAAHAPDLIFLDITMPGGSGFDLLAHERIAASVVFVTAYDDHAIRAFEVGAVDYLLKPVDPTRLADSIRRASTRSLPAPDRICITTGASVRVVAIAEIILVNAEGDYSELVLRDGATVMVKQPLTSWVERLGDAFVRVSRSALVSIADIETVERDDGSAYRLVLRGYPNAVSVSRSRGTAVKAALRGKP
jgi:two-component system LytT family response regulator